MVDVSKLRKGVTIRLKTGDTLTVRGCYMSPEGIVVTAHPSGAIVDRNVPMADIQEIVE
jgi:hypothetical protein